MTSTSAAVSPSRSVRAAASPNFARRILHKPLAVVCFAYLGVLITIAVLAPLLLPDVATERAGDLTRVREGPSFDHLLGTDTLGRDVLSRLLVGTRIALFGVAEALLVVLVIGVPVGLAAGFFRGWFDRMVSWLADIAFAIPAIILVLVVLSIFPQSMAAAMITFGVLAAPGLIRIVRASTFSVREEAYIEAARVSGLSRRFITARHILPRISGPIIVQASLLAAVALLIQSGLSFLQLVVADPAPSWGGMVANGSQAIDQQPWLIVPPGLTISLTILTLGLLGDAVRDATTEAWAPPAQPRRRGPAVATARSTDAPTSRPNTLLAVDSLCITFPSPAGMTRVVEGATFDVGFGESVAIVGESGCGKTVTAMAILGVLPGSGSIESGRIVFDGSDLTALSPKEMRRLRGGQIALVSQEPMISLNPAFQVGHQLAEAVRLHQDCSRATARAKALELLERVRLSDPTDVARRYPHQLSGGMAQRVAIARALAGEPRLLIADEPTTALDVMVQAEILALLHALGRDHGMAILLITHDWGVVADLCDRAFVMYAGHVVESGTVAAIFDQPYHPYTEGLLASNPHAAVDRAEGITVAPLTAIRGSVPAPQEWPAGCHFHPRCDYATSLCASEPIPMLLAEPARWTRCIHFEKLRTPHTRQLVEAGDE